MNMITLIHGADIVSSRGKLVDLKQKYAGFTLVDLDGTKLVLSQVQQACDTQSLFGEQTALIIENLLARGINKKKQSIIDYLSKISIPVVIWEGKEVSKSLVKKYFSKASEIKCSYPALLFKFLDSIGMEPPVLLIEKFHLILKEKEPELVLSMLFRQFRYLIIVKDLGRNKIPSLSPWQIAKFARQASGFSMGKLVSVYRDLLSIDYKIKSGKTPYSLVELLDIFLLTF